MKSEIDNGLGHLLGKFNTDTNEDGTVNEIDTDTKNNEDVDVNTGTESNNNNNKMDEILKLGEDTANIAIPSLDTLFPKKKKKKGTNIYLNEEVFNKVVTLSMESGESLTAVMEKIITATVQDVKIKQHLVREYNNKMAEKRKPKNTNK